MNILVHFRFKFVLAALVVLFGADTLFAADFSLSLQSAEGDPVGKGKSVHFEESNASIPFNVAYPGVYAEVRNSANLSDTWVVEFRAPANGPFSIGVYDVDLPNMQQRDMYQPYMFVRPAEKAFTKIKGQFEVKKVVYAKNGVSLWIAFTQFANGSTGALTGEFKIDVDESYTPENLMPRVYVGEDRGVSLGVATSFKAVVQDDNQPDGQTSIKWSVTNSSGSSGPVPVTISDNTASNPTMTFMAVGNYNVVATVSDGKLSSSDWFQVYVFDTRNLDLLRLNLPAAKLGLPSGTFEADRNRAAFSGSASSGGTVVIEVQKRGTDAFDTLRFSFSAPNNLKPAPGIYPVGSDVTGGMTVSVSVPYSNLSLKVAGGSVQIVSAQYEANNSLTSFHALFTLYTDESDAPITGELRYRIHPETAGTETMVSAGIDRTFTSLVPPVLNGSVLMRGGSATPPTVKWTKVSGPGDVEFANDASLVTPVTLSEEGTYVLRLEVADESGMHSDEVQITNLRRELSIVYKSLGASGYFVPPANKITAVSTSNSLTFTATDKEGTNSKRFYFAAPQGGSLGVGTYETESSRTGSMEVPFGNYYNGEFEIVELERDGTGKVISAFVKYKADYSGSSYGPENEKLEGEIRYYTAERTPLVNRAPSVNAGGDFVTSARILSLRGVVTDDFLPYGKKLQYSWRMLSGPMGVVFSDSNSYSTDVTFFADGFYRLLFAVTDGELTTTDEVIVIVKNTNRRYEGVIRYENTIAGRAVINLTAKNAFSARLQVGKSVVNFSGNLSSGTWSREGVSSDGRNIRVEFWRDEKSGSAGGSVSIDGARLSFAMEQTYASFQRTALVDCPYRGRRVIGLIPPSDGPVAGLGYGDIVVQPSGAYRLRGTLADGVPFSTSGNLSIDGRIDLYIRLRNGFETVVGFVAFSENNSRLGTVGWYRQPGKREAMYPSGLSLPMAMIAVPYQLPAPGETPFRTIESVTAKLQFLDSALPAPIEPVLTFTGDQVQVSGAPSNFKVKFDRKTGFFSGSFMDPGKPVIRRFAGVIDQNARDGVGFLLMDKHSGSVRVIPQE